MGKRGRPEADDDDNVLAMAKLIYETPSMCPTAAFRLVFQSMSQEQSEEAARVRLLRKFKRDKRHLMAKVKAAERRPVTYRPSGGALARAVRDAESLTASGALARAVRDMESLTASGALAKAVRDMESLTASGALAKAVRDMESLTASGAVAQVMRDMERLNYFR